MNITSILKKVTALTVATVLMSVYALSAHTSAVPYDPNHPGTNTPAFNIFTGTPSVGNEADFLRGKEETSTGYVNDVQSACADGTRFTLRAYVHNAANQNLNNGGNGPGVAHGSKVRIALPGQSTASNFAINGVISASNASSVSDGMTINCGGGKVVALSYVNGSAKQFTVPGGTQALSDSIVTNGAPIGTNAPNGDVWGCWDQRVWVTLTVVVKETPPEVPPSSGVCKAVDLVVLNREQREVKVTVNGEVSNAQIVGYSIDFGDGTTSTNQSETHKYSTDGTYIIRTSVQIKLADGTVVTRTADTCNKQITFKGDQPPEIVPPPTTPGQPELPSELPSAGAGGIIATFLGVSSISSALYYAFVRRFDI